MKLNQLKLSVDELNLRVAKLVGNCGAKRALHIALVGRHPIQFIGSLASQAQDFALLASQAGVTTRWIKPCECGHYNDPRTECRCKDGDVKTYRYINIFNYRPTFHLNVVVDQPRKVEVIAFFRGTQEPFAFDSSEHWAEEPDAETPLTRQAEEILSVAIDKLDLSISRVNAVIQVARTIRVMEDHHQELKVGATHISEAIQYQQAI